MDHCFARIIYDAVIGENGPWTAKLNAPAIKNMTIEQLERCVMLGEGIATGAVNLVDMDERSLAARGKVKIGKRKRDDDGEGVKLEQESGTTVGRDGATSMSEQRLTKSRQIDIRDAFSRHTELSTKPSHSPTEALQNSRPRVTAGEIDYAQQLVAKSELTLFRK